MASGINVREYSSLSLAYIGDAVYEIYIRTMILAKGQRSVNAMHHETTAYVQASAQSELVRILEPLMTEEEHDVYRRGRNAKSGSVPRNQSMSDYRRATGFEALIGYLYLTGQQDRIRELLDAGIDKFPEP